MNIRFLKRGKIFCWLTTICIISLLYTFVYNWKLKSILCCDVLSATLSILNGITLSIIASYIFYLFTIYIPQIEKENNTKKIILPLLNDLCSSINNIIQDVSGCCTYSELNAKSWDSICSSVEYTDFNQYTIRKFLRASGKYDNWLGYFYELIKEEDEVIRKINLYGSSIPENILCDLNSLGSNSELYTYLSYEFSMQPQDINSINGDGIHLSGISKYIWSHFVHIHQIRDNYSLFSNC